MGRADGSDLSVSGPYTALGLAPGRLDMTHWLMSICVMSRHSAAKGLLVNFDAEYTSCSQLESRDVEISSATKAGFPASHILPSHY